MYYRRIESKQVRLTVGGKPQPTALESHIAANRSRAAERMVPRNPFAVEAARIRFIGQVGKKTGAH